MALTKMCPACYQQEMIELPFGWECRSCRFFQLHDGNINCPGCAGGEYGKDALCVTCWCKYGNDWGPHKCENESKH